MKTEAKRAENFIDRSVFARILATIPKKHGGSYSDITPKKNQKPKETAYGDMSRLVVKLLATKTPKEIAELYRELGWGGKPMVRSLHEAAKKWCKEHRDDS